MRLYVLSALFLISLLVSISASAAFTRRLETLSDRFHFSPGLLSLLGALGANIPNYVASLAAAASGQVGEGIGIIIKSPRKTLGFSRRERRGVPFKAAWVAV